LNYISDNLENINQTELLELIRDPETEVITPEIIDEQIINGSPVAKDQEISFEE
jgi:hypothetical protein